jgi:hypothetical protein
MTRWDGPPASFRFAVRDTTQKDTAAVFKTVNGRLHNSGRKVNIAPFTKKTIWNRSAKLSSGSERSRILP